MWTPFPNPSPQGGGERESGARDEEELKAFKPSLRAQRSNPSRGKKMDCFGASLLAMTVEPTFPVMAGHSRPKDGVASARLCPGHPRLLSCQLQNVDARDKPGHDDLGPDSPLDSSSLLIRLRDPKTFKDLTPNRRLVGSRQT